jgi:hypothetical protein
LKFPKSEVQSPRRPSVLAQGLREYPAMQQRKVEERRRARQDAQRDKFRSEMERQRIFPMDD